MPSPEFRTPPHLPVPIPTPSRIISEYPPTIPARSQEAPDRNTRLTNTPIISARPTTVEVTRPAVPVSPISPAEQSKHGLPEVKLPEQDSQDNVIRMAAGDDTGQPSEPPRNNAGGLPKPASEVSGNIPVSSKAAAKVIREPIPADKPSYRIPGELERADPTIEPLPPTPITDEARDRLRSWGVTDEHIEELRDLTSSFRYDLVPQKAERTAQNGGFVTQNSEGAEEIVLPNSLNTIGRGDGHCGAIGKDTLIALNQTGYLGKANQQLAKAGEKPLQPYLVTGQSRTHFNRPASEHVWVALGQKGLGSSQVVTIDGSFQEISTSPRNGYVEQKIFINPRTLIYTPNSVIGVGSYKENANGSFEYQRPKVDLVMGTSSDGTLVYNLTFLKNSNTQQIHPAVTVLTATPDKSPNGTPIALIKQDGSIAFNNSALLTDSQKGEILSILTKLSAISLIRDKKKAQILKNESLTIQLGETPKKRRRLWPRF